MDEVQKLMSLTLCKTCLFDLAPLWLVNDLRLLLPPFIALLLYQSLAYWSFPVRIQGSSDLSKLKKDRPDPSQMKNCRPVSNVYVVSKLLARIVQRQLQIQTFANSGDLMWQWHNDSLCTTQRRLLQRCTMTCCSLPVKVKRQHVCLICQYCIWHCWLWFTVAPSAASVWSLCWLWFTVAPSAASVWSLWHCHTVVSLVSGWEVISCCASLTLFIVCSVRQGSVLVHIVCSVP